MEESLSRVTCILSATMPDASQQARTVSYTSSPWPVASL